MCFTWFHLFANFPDSFASRLGLCVCVFCCSLVGLVVGFFLWGNLFSITGSLQLLTDQVSH